MGIRFLGVLAAAVVVSAFFGVAAVADTDLGSSAATQAQAAGRAVETGLGPVSIFNHVGPGADFDKTGAATRVFTVAGPPPVPPAAEPFTLVAPALPGGAVEIKTYISWTWLFNGGALALDTITVDNLGGGGPVPVVGNLVGTGTPDLCWAKEGAASYLADVTGTGIVALGAGNSIGGATDKALGADPNAYGEGLSILLVYEIAGQPLRNVDVYAGYASTESGPVLGTANVRLTFRNPYQGGDLHFFLNAADGQSITGLSGAGFGDDFFINGVLASGVVAGTAVPGDAWQGLLPAGPPSGPPPATDWLYDHANDDVSAFMGGAALGLVASTVRPPLVAGDCIGHSLAAVSFPWKGVPAVGEWGLAVMTLLVLAAGTVVLVRRRRLAAQA